MWPFRKKKFNPEITLEKPESEKPEEKKDTSFEIERCRKEFEDTYKLNDNFMLCNNKVFVTYIDLRFLYVTVSWFTVNKELKHYTIPYNSLSILKPIPKSTSKKKKA